MKIILSALLLLFICPSAHSFHALSESESALKNQIVNQQLLLIKFSDQLTVKQLNSTTLRVGDKPFQIRIKSAYRLSRTFPNSQEPELKNYFYLLLPLF